MLWIYAKINSNEIGRLAIHNQGEIRKGVYEYRVYKSEGGDINAKKFKVVRHKRDDGWEKLAIKALKVWCSKQPGK